MCAKGDRENSKVMLTYREDANPAIFFFINDWQSEPGLRLCSLGARGLWIEMLCIMFKGNPRGTLTVNGTPINSKDLAMLVGSTEKSVNKLLTELSAKRVYSILDGEDGIIYNRKMYRLAQSKETTSKKRSKAGKKGADVRWGKDKIADDEIGGLQKEEE